MTEGRKLSLLVQGTLLPLILFAVGLVYVYHQRGSSGGFDRVLETVRGVRLLPAAGKIGLQIFRLSYAQCSNACR